MSRLRKVADVFTSTFTVLLPALLLVAQADAATSIDTIKNSTAVITTADGLGAGIVVGSSGNSVIVVTAAHVVIDDENKIRGSITVKFRPAAHKTWPARVHNKFMAELDIAAVIVDDVDAEVINALSSIPYRTPNQVAEFSEVSVIGHPGGNEWDENVRTNRLKTSDHAGKFALGSAGVAEGSSGGALLDSANRLIGMITSIGTARTTAVKIDGVLSALAGWSLSTGKLSVDDLCTVLVDSTPDGATVHVNGAQRGVTPLSLELKESEPVTVKFAKQGYKEEVQTVNCGRQRVDQTLQSADCRVSVTANVDDAEVYVNDDYKGTTPMTVSIPSTGSAALRVEGPAGRGTFTKMVTCATGTVNATLQKTTGTIKLYYTGDYYGCNLDLRITFNGEKTVRPTSNAFTVRDVPLGSVDYEVSGRIRCPTGMCNVSGGGVVDIDDGDALYVGWALAGAYSCDVTLNEQ